MVAENAPDNVTPLRWPLPHREELHIRSHDDLIIFREIADVYATGIICDATTHKPKTNENGDFIFATAVVRGSSRDKRPRILWTGIIDVQGIMSYEISSDGTLDYSDGLCIFRITSTHGETHTVRTSDVAASTTRNFREMRWLDSLGFTSVESPSIMGKYIRSKGEIARLNADLTKIRGQGAFKLEDGTPMLATASGVYNADGELIGNYETDLTSIKSVESRKLHDILPTNENSQELIIRGLDCFADLLNSSETYPEIPAAHLGQVLISILAPLDKNYGCGIWLHAGYGSGKSYFEKYISAIQSRSNRVIRSIKPELNLGDESGTFKGPKYTVRPMGLGSLLIDDAIKGDTDNTKTVDSLLRSYEEGGGATAGIDRSKDEVISRDSGRLRTSIRVTAEKPPANDKSGEKGSTADRIIIQGGWSKDREWYDIFDREITERLHLPENVNAAFSAYSAISLWVWQNRDSLIVTLYSEATFITSQWEMNSTRVRTAYTTVVCGLLALRDFSKTHDRAIDVNAAIDALRIAAEIQAAPDVDIVKEFFNEMRLGFLAGNLAGVGRPIRGDHALANHFVYPYRAIIAKDDKGTPQLVNIEWPTGINKASDMGLTVTSRNDGLKTAGFIRPKPKNSRALRMFVKPPADKAKRGKRPKFDDEWCFVIESAQFELLCRTLTMQRGRNDVQFNTATMRDKLTDYYQRIRIYVEPDEESGSMGTVDDSAPQPRVYTFPTQMIFSEMDDD